jgi:hypothetical protein
MKRPSSVFSVDVQSGLASKGSVEVRQAWAWSMAEGKVVWDPPGGSRPLPEP